jgi:hypothetical protein
MEEGEGDETEEDEVQVIGDVESIPVLTPADCPSASANPVPADSASTRTEDPSALVDSAPATSAPVDLVPTATEDPSAP